MVVRDAMTDYFASANIRSTVGDAMDKMLAEGLDTLLIVDDSSKLVGSLRESFLMEALLDRKLQHDSVSIHMERHFISICPDESIYSVVVKFLQNQTSELPVLVSGKLVGVLTRRQLLRAANGSKELKLSQFANNVA